MASTFAAWSAKWRDSSFPGSQFLEMVDAITGAALPGSPALVQTPNMGTANFTG